MITPTSIVDPSGLTADQVSDGTALESVLPFAPETVILSPATRLGDRTLSGAVKITAHAGDESGAMTPVASVTMGRTCWLVVDDDLRRPSGRFPYAHYEGAAGHRIAVLLGQTVVYLPFVAEPLDTMVELVRVLIPGGVLAAGDDPHARILLTEPING